jgi:ribonuclease D
MTPTFEFIDTFRDLESLADRLSQQEVIAVDIEADSLHHYSPKICLIQISTSEETFIIDPIATQSIAPLSLLLEPIEIKKIFHGADYDLRSLYRDFAITVPNLFDTMVASQFLGQKEVGLASVLNTRFGVTLNKKYQKANWSKRPLPNDMLLYAACDTAHLIRLYQELSNELALKGRLDWVEEECELLSVECSTPNKTQWTCGLESGNACTRSTGNSSQKLPLFKRFKGAGAMSPRDLAVLERLLSFREKRAKQQDRPPFKLFGNNLIKQLVVAKPIEASTLKKMSGLPRDFMKRYAKGALAAIRAGLAMRERELPVYPKTPRPPRNPKKQVRVRCLKHWRDTKAKKFKLEPGILCNNSLLDAVAEVNPRNMNALKTIPGMKRWQAKVLGKEMIQTLRDNV